VGVLTSVGICTINANTEIHQLESRQAGEEDYERG